MHRQAGPDVHAFWNEREEKVAEWSLLREHPRKAWTGSLATVSADETRRL